MKDAIRKLLGIDEALEIYGIETYKKRGKTYYRLVCYDRRTKNRGVKVHVPRRLEREVLHLWGEYQKRKAQEEELKLIVQELLTKYRDPQLIKKVVEEVLSQNLKRKAKDYAYERYKSQALELFEKLKPYLLLLKRAKVRRIKPLEALYLLAGVSEGFKGKDEDKALKRALQTIVKRDRNKNLKNPFGVLKSDFFLKETPYEFLLSSFLQEELNPFLDKLLEAELQKAQAQEFLTKASDLVAGLSPKAKERVLKVFGSFSEFTGTLYRHWQATDEEIESYLRSWKDYLETETQNEEEEKSITDSLKRLRESVNEPHDQ